MRFDDDLRQLITEAVAAGEEAGARRELPSVERALGLAEEVRTRLAEEWTGERALAAYLMSFLLLLRADLRAGAPARADLDRALEMARLSVRLREVVPGPASHLPSVAAFTGQLTAVRLARMRILGGEGELDGAIEAARHAVALPGVLPPERAAALATLCGLLVERHLRAGAPGDLDDAVEAGREAVETAGPAHASYAGACNNLALALRNRYERRGGRADLDQAVARARDGVRAATDVSERGRCLSTLAGVLVARFERHGGLRDLDEAIGTCRAALACAGLPLPLAAEPHGVDDRRPPAAQDASDAVPVLLNLAVALRLRHERTGAAPDLDESVAAARQSVLLASPHHADYPGCLDQLSTTLQQRFPLSGDREDLDEAVDAGCKALNRCPARHPARRKLLSNHARVLHMRFALDGDAGDLDGAITTVREGLRAAAPGDAGYALCHVQLATLTLSRHRLAGDPVDLDTAVAAASEAVAATAPGSPDEGILLNMLGIAHQVRFAQWAEPADIEAAVRAGRQAVRATPVSHWSYALCRQNLGNTLLTRWLWRLTEDGTGGPGRRVGEPLPRGAADLTDLDGAVAAHRAALDAAEGTEARAMCSLNLGAALRWRYEQTGSAPDGAEAEVLLREASRLIPVDGPVHGRALSALAELLRVRHERTADRDSAAEAVAVWRRAARLSGAAASDRIESAASWGVLALRLGRREEAVEGLAAAVDLLPLLAWRGLPRTERERLLGRCAGLAQDAAAVALSAGRPEEAVELLERGRSVLWSQLLEQKTELEALHEAAPVPAARLARVRAALDAYTGLAPLPPTAPFTTGSGTDTPSPVPVAGPLWLRQHDAAHRRMVPAREWDDLVDEVRGLPGFGDFLRRPRLSEVRSGLPGPVVVLNVSTLRCDALIVTRDTVRVVPLPRLTAREAHTRAVGLLTTLHEADRAGGAAAVAARMVREQTLLDVLEWLWEVVAAPVLEALGLTAPVPPDGPWRRLWWCPTGPLALLPLHAAGRAPEPGSHRPPPGDSVLDRVISSYASTLRSLVPAAVRPGAGYADRAGKLTVTVAEAPGLPVLHGVRREAETVARLSPVRPHVRLDGPEATRDSVRTALARCAWAHVACHGSQNLMSPSRSGLRLHDGLLTVAEFAAAGTGGPGELVYLSACDTAMGGVEVPDEAVTLAHAFQFTGFRQVVATLWSVEDGVAVRTAEDFYTRLAGAARTEPVPAAEALHHAVRAARARMPYAPGRWACFVHVGA